MKKIGILFPGQGPQYPGMGKMFFDADASCRELYARASEVLGYDLARLSFDGELEKISDTRYAQPALVTAGYAAFRCYVKNFGSTAFPSSFAGHSMGEITALLAADTLSFEDAVRLAQKRGELMHQMAKKHGGAMAAIKEMEWYETELICREINTTQNPVSIAAYNTATQCVITGTEQAVNEAGEQCAAHGGIFVPLNITVASHCVFMEEILAEFSEVVEKCELKRPLGKVYSCATGQPYRSVSDIRKNIVNQLTLPVKWLQITADLFRNDVSIFLDAGPGSAMGKLIDPRKGQVLALDKLSVEDVRLKLTDQIKFLPTPITKCLALAVSLPNLNPVPNETYTQFITEYGHVRSLQETLEKESRPPSMEEMQRALRMLDVAMNVKQTSHALRRQVSIEVTASFPGISAPYEQAPL